MKWVFALWVCLFFSACSPVWTGTPVPAAPDRSGLDAEMETAFQQARDSLEFFV
ncbi:MAG TPA: hypothetical protein VFZ43_05290 [Anaerolineales bacterium]